MKQIEGVKLIKHNASNIDILLTKKELMHYPYKLEILLRPPVFMQFAFICLYGNEHIIIISKTKEALKKCINLNKFNEHPRLISMKINNKKYYTGFFEDNENRINNNE